MSTGNKILGAGTAIGALWLLPKFILFVAVILLIGGVGYGVDSCWIAVTGQPSFVTGENGSHSRAWNAPEAKAYRSELDTKRRKNLERVRGMTFEELKETWYEHHHPRYRTALSDLGEEWATEAATECLNAVKLNSIKSEDGIDSCDKLFSEWP